MPDHRHWEIRSADPALDAIEIVVRKARIAVDGIIHAELRVFIDAELVIWQQIDSLEIFQILIRREKIDDGANLRLAVVDPFQERHSHLHAPDPCA